MSVVSVPANQTAVFSIAKSFDNMEEYEKFKQQFTADTADKAQKIDTNVDIDAPQAAWENRFTGETYVYREDRSSSWC